MIGRLPGKVAIVTGAAPRGEGVGNGMATANGQIDREEYLQRRRTSLEENAIDRVFFMVSVEASYACAVGRAV